MWIKGVALIFTKEIPVLEGSKRKGGSFSALFLLKRNTSSELIRHCHDICMQINQNLQFQDELEEIFKALFSICDFRLVLLSMVLNRFT